MADIVTRSARSIRGCWTCRVRKKKCDENRPRCSTCIFLKIECHGYGEKPLWMDNGRLQREQASRVKSLVSQNSSKRRRRPAQLLPSSPHQHLDINYENSTKASTAISNHLLEEVPLHMSELDTMVLGDWAQYHPWNTDLDIYDQEMSDGFARGNLSTLESLSGDRSWETSAWLGNSFCSSHEAITSEDSTASRDLTSSSFTFQNIDECAQFITEEHSGAYTASAAEPPSSYHRTLSQALSANEVIKECSMGPSYPDELMLRDEIEDRLFMHYLDEVFYIQYPFYDFPIKQSRGWLFSTLRRTKSVYHATLALSQRHLRSTTEISVLTTLSNIPNFYHIALQEVEISKEKSSSLIEIAGVAYVLQILFYELFTGGKGNWRQLLVMASPLILPLVQARTNPTGARSTISEKGMPLSDDMGTKVLLGSLISIDIIASASTRSSPSFKFDHKIALEIFEVKIESLFGCANWVMILILDIVVLDNWKKEAENAHELSITELVKRGSKIEECLRQKITDLEGTPSLLAAQAEVTRIFALSALTYLHVVISGAHPGLPEITENVSKTIDAFKRLSKPKLLRNIVWPFCVTGCLAPEAEQGFFRNLVSKAEIVPSTLGTCLQAFKIVQECWEIRKTCSYDCDWVLIMNRLDCKILLA